MLHTEKLKISILEIELTPSIEKQLDEGAKKPDLPIACTLTPGELNVRREGLLHQIGRFLQETQERADGFAYRFPPECWDELAQIIGKERQCCAFLRFTLTAEPGNGPLWLEVTGPAGSKEFLTDFWK